MLLGGNDGITSEVSRLVSQLPPAVQALTGVDVSKVIMVFEWILRTRKWKKKKISSVKTWVFHQKQTECLGRDVRNKCCSWGSIFLRFRVGRGRMTAWRAFIPHSASFCATALQSIFTSIHRKWNCIRDMLCFPGSHEITRRATDRWVSHLACKILFVL